MNNSYQETKIVDKQQLYEWEDTIWSIYKTENLSAVDSLSDFNDLYYEATRKASCEHDNEVNFMALRDDLSFCSREAAYFTAHLFMYKPYINNLLANPIWFGGKWVYPNITHDNIFDRYVMFADVALQSIYNYWDRIGDVLAYYFKDSMRIDSNTRIYFPVIVDKIERAYRSNSHYIWLKHFKENQYTKLNGLRTKTVHSETFSTRLKNLHLEDPTDRQKIEALQAEREGLADYFKKHIQLSIEGFRETMLFLKDLTPTLYSHIE